MNLQEILKIFIISLAVSTISVTITKAKIFEPFRLIIEKKHKKLGELFHCPYCLSNWISFFFVLLYRPHIFINGLFLTDQIVAAFVMIELATFWSLIVIHSLEKMDKYSIT